MRDELVIFDDVISPDTHTIPSLRKVLLFPELRQGDSILSSPSVLTLLNSAGFTTYWISNQAVNVEGATGVRLFAEDAKHVSFLNMARDEGRSVSYDAVVLPGGPQGSVNLAANPQVIEFVSRHDAAGKLICPICSAAARVLGGNGLLKGRRYVCSGDLYKTVTDGVYVDAPVVEDGHLLSGKGLGHIFDFALTLSARLLGNEQPVREHAEHIYYPW